MTEAKAPGYIDHRKRLRQRFLNGGGDALSDYELLELLLTMALPRGDVKPLAKALDARFGGFAGAVNASVDDLRSVKGMGEVAPVALKVVRAAANRLLRTQITGKTVFSNLEAVLDYCRLAMAYERQEQFRILFLDRKNRLMADEIQQRGTVDQAPVYPREVARRAIELNATAVIMVHNHPSGDPTPSQSDIAITKQVSKALKAVGVTPHDHIVVARDGHASMRAMGLM